ncbi:MAG: antirestriction protein ArdA [Fuerstiella sp.]
MLGDMPENLRYYFNFEAYARDCEMGGDMTFVNHDGEVWAFNNHA